MKHTIIAFVALLGLSSSAAAIEMTAGSRSAQDNASFEMRLRASTAALETIINRMLTCNNKDMIFASDEGKAGRDAEGCVAVGGGGNLDNMEIYDEEVITDYPSLSCTGRNSCSVGPIDMSPYLDKKNVTVIASCDPAAGGWGCRSGEGIAGSLLIPNMNASFSGTVMETSGSKRSRVTAAYNASSQSLQVAADYEGDSTDNKNVGVHKVSISYTVTKLRPLD